MKQLEQDVLAIMLGEALHPNQQKIDVVDDEKIDAKDFAKLRAMKNKKTGKIHNCAVHVEHPEYGEGSCISEAHADPDEDGNIAWYTAKFESGTYVVQTEDIDILASESHMHEEAEQIDELSPSTLTSYRHKARNSELRSAETARRDTEISQQTTNPRVAAKSAAYAAQAQATVQKRRAGQLKATSRLSNEEVEQTDEAMSHQAATTMKHIKPGTLKQNYGDRKDAANIKPGIKGVSDRIAMLDRAKKEGRLKEDIEQIEEAPKTDTKYSVEKIHRHPDGAHTVKIKYTHPNGESGHHIHSGKPAYVAKLVKDRYNLSIHTAKMANEDVNFTDLEEARGLAGMTMDQLKQEHDKVQNKINDIGKSRLISMNHPLSQRARLIRLHMAIKKKQANEEVQSVEEMDSSMAYATGTKRAMQMTGDKPPLEKSTIKKAHKIAKAMLRKEEVEEEQFTDYDELIEGKPFEFDLQDSYNFGDYLKTAKQLVGEEDAINLANEAFNKQDISLFVEEMTRNEVESRVKTHMNAGHEVSTPKYSTRDGKFHAEFIVKDKESGVRRKYIYHGNTRKMENMGTPGKRD